MPSTPVLQIRIGSSIREVQHLSDIKFSLDKKDDNSSVILDQPATVKYVDTEGAFTLPPTRYVWISQAAGIVTGFSTTPQLDYLDLPEANSLANTLVHLINQSGWKIIQTFPGDLAVLQQMVRESDPEGFFEKSYGKWRLRSNELSISVKRQWDGQANVRRQVFLVNVEVDDTRLADEQSDKVYARRKQQNGSLDKPVPLSEWLK